MRFLNASVASCFVFASALCGGIGCVKPDVVPDASTADSGGVSPTDGGGELIIGVTPTTDTVAAAQVLQQQFPGASVTFSQHTGAIIEVDAPGLNGLFEPVAAPTVPLVESHGNDEAGHSAALMEFFLRAKAAYGLGDPASELQVPRDAANDSISLSQERFNNGDAPALRGLRRRRLVQNIQGVRVPGREVVGLFDVNGGLLSVSSRLLKVDATFPVLPAFSGTDVWQRFQTTGRDAAVQKNPSLGWLQNTALPTANLEHAAELVVEMLTPDGRLDSADPTAVPRLAYRLELRGPGLQAFVSVDALSAVILAAVDTMPSDWISEGRQVLGASYDELGKSYTLFLATDFAPNRYLGIIPLASGSPSWVAAGQAVVISTTQGTTNAALIYPTPITIPMEIAGQTNYWYSDPAFTGARRQAAPLMTSVMATFDYWANRRFWNGWDGQGSNFYAGIFTHKSANPSPELNAWGSNGVIQIGDGTTSTGQYCGASHTIMGHELTHNVISATTKLTYANESGAVNEALADFFGMAVNANRGTDDFSSVYLGRDIGWDLRNMEDPTATLQPDSYKNYQKILSDSGGVHTNSGILNKAHTLLVKGGTFNGYTIARVGLARVEQIIWASMRFQSYGTEATMEEFARGVLSICNFTKSANALLGDTSYAATCASFRKAYTAVGVLPSLFSQLAVSAATVNGGILKALAENNSGKDVSAVVSHSTFKITDVSSGKLYLVPAQALKPAADGGTVSDFINGERLVLTANLPDELLNAGDARHMLDVNLELDTIHETTQTGALLHHARVMLAADLVAARFTLAVSPRGGNGAFILTADALNHEGSGVSPGVKATVLARNGGHAQFDLFTGLTGTDSVGSAQSGPGPFALFSLVTGPASNYSFANGLLPILLPTATPVPGHPGQYQVWFDGLGGLDALNAGFQVYVLVDSADQVDERDETNNLLCVNCRSPGQAEGTSGVIVRLPLGSSVATLFPAAVRAAAAKLPAAYPRSSRVKELQTVHLPYKTALVPK